MTRRRRLVYGMGSDERMTTLLRPQAGLLPENWWRQLVLSLHICSSYLPFQEIQRPDIQSPQSRQKERIANTIIGHEPFKV